MTVRRGFALAWLLWALVAQRARCQEIPQAAAATVINDGVPGENSTELRARFAQQVAKFHPRFVVLYTGMNDAANPGKFTSLDDFGKNLQWMLDATVQAHAEPVLVAIQPVDGARLMQRHKPEDYGSRTPNELIADRNALLLHIASARGLTPVRFDEVLTAAGGPNAQWSSDGVHLYAAGYKLLANAVWQALQPLWKPGDTVLRPAD